MARLAQSAERKALNLVVVGSSPTVGVLLVSFIRSGGSAKPLQYPPPDDVPKDMPCWESNPGHKHGRLVEDSTLKMSAVGFEPTRSCLQWILSPPP